MTFDDEFFSRMWATRAQPNMMDLGVTPELYNAASDTDGSSDDGQE